MFLLAWYGLKGKVRLLCLYPLCYSSYTVPRKDSTIMLEAIFKHFLCLDDYVYNITHIGKVLFKTTRCICMFSQ